MKFEVGKSYQARSSHDIECVWTFTVVSRTAKFITVTETHEPEPKRVGVKEHGGVEWATPLGRFAFSPTISAGRPVEQQVVAAGRDEDLWPRIDSQFDREEF